MDEETRKYLSEYLEMQDKKIKVMSEALDEMMRDLRTKLEEHKRDFNAHMAEGSSDDDFAR